MVAKKKKESRLSFETDQEQQEENKLKISPEDIVRLREELGILPDEFNPYGTGYKIPNAKFLGDEPPFDQYGEDRKSVV